MGYDECPRSSAALATCARVVSLLRARCTCTARACPLLRTRGRCLCPAGQASTPAPLPLLSSHQPEGPTSMCRLGHSFLRGSTSAPPVPRRMPRTPRTALLTAVTRSSPWHPAVKDSCERKQKLHAQFQGCPGSSDHPKSAVRSHLPNTALHVSAGARRTGVPQTL